MWMEKCQSCCWRFPYGGICGFACLPARLLVVVVVAAAARNIHSHLCWVQFVEGVCEGPALRHQKNYQRNAASIAGAAKPQRERESESQLGASGRSRESNWVLIWVQLRERERARRESVRAFCAIHAKDTENICCRCRLRCWRRCLRPVFVFALCFCFLLIFLYTIFM